MQTKKIFAHYSLVDRQIHNINSDSRLFYMHEYRHEWQDKQGVISMIFMLNYYAIVFFILLSIWDINFIYAYPFITLGCMLLLEIDAWIYAFRNRKVPPSNYIS